MSAQAVGNIRRNRLGHIMLRKVGKENQERINMAKKKKSKKSKGTHMMAGGMMMSDKEMKKKMKKRMK